MPEWSKGVDLRSTVYARVGSNPTSSTLPWCRGITQDFESCNPGSNPGES